MGDIFIVHANQHLPRQMTTSVNSNQSHTFLHREQIISYCASSWPGSYSPPWLSGARKSKRWIWMHADVDSVFLLGI